MNSLLTKFTKKFTDCSTIDTFQYIFYCDQCGKPWKSSPIRYKKGPNELEKQSYAWNRAYEDAFRAAAAKGMLCYSLCRKCDQWVCHEHFDFQGQQCWECSKNSIRIIQR